MTLIRFKVNWEKCLEGIHCIADAWPSVTTYFVVKSFFFADKEFLLDYGRLVSGDRYVAMENGPVPSAIYDILKKEERLEDWIIEYFENCIDKEGHRLHSRREFRADALSGVEVEYIRNSVEMCKKKNFQQLIDITHEETSWKDAWGKPGFSNEMDLFQLIPSDYDNREKFIEEILEKSILTPSVLLRREKNG